MSQGRGSFEILSGSIMILVTSMGVSEIINVFQDYPSLNEYMISVVFAVFGAATIKPPWSPIS